MSFHKVICVSMLCFGLSNAFVSPVCSDYQCSVRKDLRRDCSRKENSRDNCRARGCCFDNSEFNTIWCFYPLALPQGICPHAECQVLPEDREHCGYRGRYGASAYACKSQGCCYDKDSYGGAYCFKRKVWNNAFAGDAVGSKFYLKDHNASILGHHNELTLDCY